MLLLKNGDKITDVAKKINDGNNEKSAYCSAQRVTKSLENKRLIKKTDDKIILTSLGEQAKAWVTRLNEAQKP